MSEKIKTKVVFRKWSNGDIIALFPEEPAKLDGYDCNSYEHHGQHGAADPTGVVSRTSLAKPAEYADLAKELTGIGYELEVCERITRAMFDTRMAEAKRIREHRGRPKA